MRPATMVLVGIAVLLLGGATVWGIAGDGNPIGLTEQWTSTTGVPPEVNHHAPAAGRVADSGLVFAPISGTADTDQCALIGLSAATGTEQWRYTIPPANCTIHAVADPTLAEFDDTPFVLAATTEKQVIGLNPRTGTVGFRANLTAYGYTQPLVADFTSHQGREVVVVDVSGTVFVLRQDGSIVWTSRLGAYTWGQPAIGDYDNDGHDELVVGSGNGDLVLFDRTGTIVWNRSFEGAITWIATGEFNDNRYGIAAATTDGMVAMVDGQTGSIRWRKNFGAFAAVHAFGDGDGDGSAEVYAVAKDGRLRAVDAADGSVIWTTTLTTASVQMTPPPSLGDVTGDGAPELVAVTNNGIVSLIDPVTGEVLDTYRRDVAIWTHPTIADTDGDDALEIYVIYGDGRIVAFTAE